MSAPADHPKKLSFEISAAELRTAPLKKLKFWIDQINLAAGKRVLTKQGIVADLREHVAQYLQVSLNPSEPAEPPIPGPPTIDQDINERQWDWVDQLADEWQNCASQGMEFTLVPSESGACRLECSVQMPC